MEGSFKLIRVGGGGGHHTVLCAAQKCSSPNPPCLELVLVFLAGSNVKSSTKGSLEKFSFSQNLDTNMSSDTVSKYADSRYTGKQHPAPKCISDLCSLEISVKTQLRNIRIRAEGQPVQQSCPVHHTSWFGAALKKHFNNQSTGQIFSELVNRLWSAWWVRQ